MMEPNRVRAYLQAACTALGFDVGEVWWTSCEHGASTVASIENNQSFEDTAEINRKHLRFLQLYTSKSFDDQRSKLLNPRSELEDDPSIQDHVLSPRLVDAISSTAQVIWANCKRSEGLLGRNDMRLQTAIAMPVAMDANGDMCIVVMFSRENVQSNDDALEYLQFISKSAVSCSIPCLLPVLDQPVGESSGSQKKLKSIEPIRSSHLIGAHDRKFGDQSRNCPSRGNSRMDRHAKQLTGFGDGVITRFMSLNDTDAGEDSGESCRNDDSNVEVHSRHELSEAPTDCFGIPMLPSFAELGNNTESNSSGHLSPTSIAAASDAFDEASYGVWTTIMHNDIDRSNDCPELKTESNAPSGRNKPLNPDAYSRFINVGSSGQLTASSRESSSSTLSICNAMPQIRKERLEEFASAFLGMSVFDVADVWLPSCGENFDTLTHVLSVTSTDDNYVLEEFKKASRGAKIKIWSGAVGRAFGSGNPVWSANHNVIVDSDRAEAFKTSHIQTVLAIPVFSGGGLTPVCVLGCYSLVRTDSVPFVLRFVQQALRLLWEGLDRAVPHASIGEDRWKDVAPADLGEMAADMEMQHAFLEKKRPHDDISQVPNKDPDVDYETLSPIPVKPQVTISVDASFSSGLGFPGEYLNHPGQDNPKNGNSEDGYFIEMQSHVQQAVKSIGDAVPWMHQSIPTNGSGSKRAHMITAGSSPLPVLPDNLNKQNHHQQSQIQNKTLTHIPIRPLLQPKIELSHVDHSFNANSAKNTTNSTSKSTGQDNHSRPEDPAVARANIEAFNAMARNSRVPAPAPTPSYHANISQGHSWVRVIPQHSSGAAMPLPPRQAVPNGVSIPNSVGSMPQAAFCAPINTKAAPPPQLTVPLHFSGKACRIQGCNELALQRRPYCVRHSGNRLCEHHGCTKCAQGSTRFCIAHGGGRRCTHPGCDKGARDKFFCAAHGGGKRCIHEGCKKSAVGGSKFCTSHGGGKRCSVNGCSKSAQSSTKFCVKHGGGKKCASPGCGKVARGKTLFCAAHGGGVRCKLEGCNRVAIGKIQLCRVHGGGVGSREKTSKRCTVVTPSSPPIVPVSNNQTMARI